MSKQHPQPKKVSALRRTTPSNEFWNAITRAELKSLCGECGVGDGTKIFWAYQETKDRYQVSRGWTLTQKTIDRRHEEALRWNELMDDGTFWDAYTYEIQYVNCKFEFDPIGTTELGLARNSMGVW
jgi:hypothetical protein